MHSPLHSKKASSTRRLKRLAWIVLKRVEPGRPLQRIGTHHHQYVAGRVVMWLRDFIRVIEGSVAEGAGAVKRLATAVVV